MKIYTDGNIPTIKVSYNAGLDYSDCFQALGVDQTGKFLFDHWNKDTIGLLEEFKIVLLDRGSHVKGIFTVGTGGFTSVSVDIKLLLSVALVSASSSIILAHCHPGGGLKPSEEDLSITKKIVLACKFFGIEVLDHFILTPSGDYFSFLKNKIIGDSDENI